MPRDDLTTPSSPSDFQRTLGLNWRNAPPGMPPAMADEFLARLKAGSTVRKLTLGMREFGPGFAGGNDDAPKRPTKGIVFSTNQ